MPLKRHRVGHKSSSYSEIGGLRNHNDQLEEASRNFHESIQRSVVLQLQDGLPDPQNGSEEGSYSTSGTSLRQSTWISPYFEGPGSGENIYQSSHEVVLQEGHTDDAVLRECPFTGPQSSSPPKR